MAATAGLLAALLAACGSGGGDGDEDRGATTTVAGRGDGAATPLPGVTEDEIRIGVFHVTGAQAVAEAAGLPELDTGDMQAEAQAVIDAINADGGVAGRTIVPVFQALEATAADYGPLEEEACRAWTEDDDVAFAVAVHQNVTETVLSCISENGGVFVGTANLLVDDELLAEYDGHVLAPSTPNLSRWAAAYVDGLAEEGFFDGASAVGVLRIDRPLTQRVLDSVVRPRLEAAGVTEVVEAALAIESASAGTGDLEAAVLRFKEAGVDRVLLLTDLYEFAAMAEAQGFRPRYGLHSGAAPAFIAGLLPAEQLAGSVGIGWAPALDVTLTPDLATDASDRCDGVMSDAGVALESQLARNLARQYCDAFFLVDQALDGSDDPSTLEGFRAGLDAVGDDFAPAASFAARFGGGRADGADAVRVFVYDESCTCFRYEGDPRPMGG